MPPSATFARKVLARAMVEADTPVKAKLVYSVFQIASWNAAEVS